MKIKLFCWLTAALAFCGIMTFSACSEPDDSQNHVVKPAYLEKIATYTILGNRADSSNSSRIPKSMRLVIQ